MVLGAPIGVTPGSILFGGAGGVLAQDNTNLFWDDATNRLGIGNNAPTRQLEVTGNVHFGRAAVIGGDYEVTDSNTDNTNVASNTRHIISVGGSGAGDPSVIFDVSFARDWSVGIDNSAADSFKISEGTTIGGTNWFTILVSGEINLGNKLFPSTDNSFVQGVSGLYAGNGIPNNANGANGDYYFRGDGGVGTHIYFKAAGVWAGII